jgi:hypothetical protein
MKYYAIYDDNGYYTGFYPTDIWDEENIPEVNRIELTKEQWQEGVLKKCRVINGVHTVILETEQETQNLKYNELRENRDKLLSDSDWTQMPDSPLTDAQKQAWAMYRQSLRDLPTTVDINNIVYPEKP